MINQSSSSSMNATIPVKPVVVRKFVPLVVSFKPVCERASSTPDSFVPAKLYDDQLIQSFIQEIINQTESIRDKNPNLYAIRLIRTNQYINEKNRAELLTLGGLTKFYEVEICFNLDTEVRMLVEKIQQTKLHNIDDLIPLLDKADKYIVSDHIFAHKFAVDGKKLVVDLIKERERSLEPPRWNVFYHLYKCFADMINNCSFLAWDMPDNDLPVIKLMCDILNDSTKESRQTKEDPMPDELVLLLLEIVDTIFNKSQYTRDFMLRELKFNDVIFVIQRPTIQIREKLLVFFNNCYEKGELSLKQSLNEILMAPLMSATLSQASKDNKNTEKIIKNFAKLQKNILDQDYAQRVKSPIDQVKLVAKIKSICLVGFESNSERPLTDEEKYSRLGFSNIKNPAEDLKENKHGSLAIDFMEYFASTQSFRSIFLNLINSKLSKNPDYAFPFAKASIHMIQFLCGFLNIGEKIELNKQHEIMFIMFTMNNDGFFEFLAKTMWLFHRLWIEMKAQQLDFDRALTVLKESIFKILNDTNKATFRDELVSEYCPLIKKRLNIFNHSMDTCKYDLIKSVKSKYDKTALQPIKHLESLLTEEVIAIIKPKRLHILCKGEKFDRINARERKSRNKQVWKLSPDFNTFQVTDCDSNDREINITRTIDVDRIKEVKKEDKKQIYSLNIICSQLSDQGDESFLLANSNEEVINNWLESLKMLINRKPNENITCFVECLLDAQLLDLHTLNVELPAEMPTVPELPGSFDFNLKPSQHDIMSVAF